MPPASKERSPSPTRGRPGVAVIDEDTGSVRDAPLCTCCSPPNPLVLRPDLGTFPDGSAQYALCVLHDPDPVVYRNRGDGKFVQMPRLSLGPTGDLLDSEGNVVARVSGEAFQRLSTVDDGDPPRPSPPGGGPDVGQAGPSPDRASRPRTQHVDLTEDDFYRVRSPSS